MKCRRIHLLHRLTLIIQSAVTDEIFAVNVGVGHCCCLMFDVYMFAAYLLMLIVALALWVL